MIKYVQCIRRRPDLSVIQFRKLWTDYAATVQRIAPRLGATRMSVSTTLAVEDNVRIQTQRGTGEPFDGMIEIYFQSGAKVIETVLSNPANRAALEEMIQEQGTIVDFPNSTFFWAQDDE